MDTLAALATLIRYYILVSTTTAGSGHTTSSLSAVELMTVLFFDGFYHYDLDNPANPNNDRVLFSKGHAAPLLYALYAAAGRLTEIELLKLRQLTSPLEGHPTMQFPYTEAAAGSLGQGLSIGVGVALNALYLDKLRYKTFVLLGDSEMAEGQNWEAIQLAAHYHLHNLIGILDVNRLGQRGETMYGYDLKSYAYKLRAFGWDTIMIDGHHPGEIADAYQQAVAATDKPTMIIAQTVKGKGVSFLENTVGKHGKALSEDELQRALPELGAIDTSVRGQISMPTQQEPTTPTTKAVDIQLPVPQHHALATRKAFGNTLVELGQENPQLVVLDAELNNSTYTNLFAQSFPDRYFEMFIAEQNMVGVAQGFAHRGKIPVVSTYGAFFTRTFDQLRMAQYSHANLKCVGSHAGVAVGEDGASQMGLEDIAMFRSLRDCVMLYPSDAISARKLTRLMIDHQGMVYLRNTRNELPILYGEQEKFVVGGSKVLRQTDADVVTVVAAGITVHEALKAYQQLSAEGIFIRVIDLYCIKPLDVSTLKTALHQTTALITVEDHYETGGIGEAIKSALVNEKTPMYSLSVTKPPHSGKPEQLLAFEEIDATAIINKVKSCL